MNEFIAYCGIDCSKCEAFLATKNNDDELKKKVAKKWSTLNKVKITPSMINCLGCRKEGIKTPFCENLYPIRLCALGKKIECVSCECKKSCPNLEMIINTNKEANDRVLGENN